jgi:hypothetical protein
MRSGKLFLMEKRKLDKAGIKHFFSRVPVATVCFLCLTGLLVYGSTRLFGGVLMKELHRYDERTGLEAAQTAAPASDSPILPEETGKPVSFIITPAPSAAQPSIPEETLPLTTPRETPSATPSHTLCPVAAGTAFEREKVDLLIVAFDENHQADWIVAVAMRSGSCTAVSIPRNTLIDTKNALYDADNIRSVARMLQSVYPVRFSRYIALDTKGLAVCVDTFGSVAPEGKALDGKGAAAYLAEGGDELLRILRQQNFMRAYLYTLREAGWLKLLSSKFGLQAYIDSNLSIAQTAELYAVLKELDPDQIDFCILPVDSATLQGTRYYVPDIQLVNQLAQRLYRTQS